MKQSVKNGRELQYEAEKRYLQTEKGKLSRKKSVAKSQCKKFILDFAELKDLDQVQEWLNSKRELLTK